MPPSPRSPLSPAPPVRDGVLSEDDIQAFRELGFLVVPSLTTPADVATIRAALLGLYRRFAELPGRQAVDLGDPRGAGGAPRIPEINWTIRLAPWLRRTLAFRRCRAIASHLLGRPASHTGYDHAILKPPQNHCATAWHQDAAYAGDRPVGETIHFWIALQDVPVEMGCMEYIPGSHRGPLRPHRRRGGVVGAHALEAQDIDVAAAVACPVRAGGATLHVPRTLHYTGPNMTDQPRLAWILEFGPAPGRWVALRRALGAFVSEARFIPATNS